MRLNEYGDRSMPRIDEWNPRRQEILMIWSRKQAVIVPAGVRSRPVYNRKIKPAEPSNG